MTGFSPREIVSELDRLSSARAPPSARSRSLCAIAGAGCSSKADARRGASKKYPDDRTYGLGKTEISRRLAKLANAPFLKVEATKFTEVGYVGRDVEQIVARSRRGRHLADARDQTQRRPVAAQLAGEERVLDALVGEDRVATTRDAFRKKFRNGELDDKEIEIELAGVFEMPMFDLPTCPAPGRARFRSGTCSASPGGGAPRPARRHASRGLRAAHHRRSRQTARQRSNRAGGDQGGRKQRHRLSRRNRQDLRPRGSGGGDVSREGVQRDLLPLIEGTTVATKHGSVSTDHILFIASGAFHLSKPSDLLPELQGRLPIRVELETADAGRFPPDSDRTRSVLIKQYIALMRTKALSSISPRTPSTPSPRSPSRSIQASKISARDDCKR